MYGMSYRCNASSLYLFEVIVHSSIIFCEERHSNARLPSPTRATNTMRVVLNALRHVIVDYIGHIPGAYGNMGDDTPP